MVIATDRTSWATRATRYGIYAPLRSSLFALRAQIQIQPWRFGFADRSAIITLITSTVDKEQRRRQLKSEEEEDER
jgi:hypothetical protein